MSNYQHNNHNQQGRNGHITDQNQYIQSISYSKLAEYDSARIDLPIRKYVLITNLLREPSSPSTELEQDWFDACLDELDKEEERERQLEQDRQQEKLDKSKLHCRKPDLHIHTFYNYRNRSGFLVCTSNLL
ncbi:hypothetical protein [Parasitella parasitica]|uniref:Uncharacterized protein n=1 Tax=Parasitella parasitica TaxID=35722 RepID=A0A0B7N7A8_9FUNG|nr:hypothetical protein [Parasitella parasitica]